MLVRDTVVVSEGATYEVICSKSLGLLCNTYRIDCANAHLVHPTACFH